MMKAVNGWDFNNDIEVNNSPPVVGQYDEDEQHPKRSSWDTEKVDRYEISNMLI